MGLLHRYIGLNNAGVKQLDEVCVLLVGFRCLLIGFIVFVPSDSAFLLSDVVY